MRFGGPRAPSPRERGEVERRRGRRPGEGLPAAEQLSTGSAPHPVAAATRPLPAGGERNPALILLGEFGRAHGLRGEIRLKSYTEDPAAIAGYGPLDDGRGRTFVLAGVRRAAGDQHDMLVARVEGVTTRDGADALNRVPLHVDRARLAAAVAEDEFLLADLVGLTVRDREGATVGTVGAVPNFGAGELLEITRPVGPSLLLPFTKTFVPVVNIAGGCVVVELPAETDEDEPVEP